MDCDEIISELRKLSDPSAVEGMARYAIHSKSVLGVSVPKLRGLAKKVGRSHALGLDLWETGIFEARSLAAMVDDPAEVTEEQMERWAADFDSWAIVDGCCNNLFRRTRFAGDKAVEWSARPEEYVKRAGFVLMACLAVHDKKSEDDLFRSFLPIIVREAGDERNFVKKGVNWALRQIGKRNPTLNREAIRTAEEIRLHGSKSARWIAGDALRELQSEAVRRRLSSGTR